MGRQAIRTLTSGPVTIHSIFDSQGRRIAEYNETSGALIREYVWNSWEPIALIEGGVVYFVRVDQIGRPVFATNASGLKVWSASYLPFGEVHVATGALPDTRFPGQWYQSESGLHQNWMRDYDPTTGRYLQADPLGLADGASVYGYVRSNPARLIDPAGLFTLGDARRSLYDRGAPRSDWNHTAPFGGAPDYSDSQVLDEWLMLERAQSGWLNDLQACPCTIYDLSPNEWEELAKASQTFHPGGMWETRSIRPTLQGAGNQCIYDVAGRLMTSAPAAGTADRYSPTSLYGVFFHYFHDVDTYNLSFRLNRVDDYYSVRPVLGETCCE